MSHVKCASWTVVLQRLDNCEEDFQRALTIVADLENLLLRGAKNNLDAKMNTFKTS